MEKEVERREGAPWHGKVGGARGGQARPTFLPPSMARLSGHGTRRCCLAPSRRGALGLRGRGSGSSLILVFLLVLVLGLVFQLLQLLLLKLLLQLSLLLVSIPPPLLSQLLLL